MVASETLMGFDYTPVNAGAGIKIQAGVISAIGPDGSFTTYTKITDVLLDQSDQTNVVLVTAGAIDEVNGWVYFEEAQAPDPSGLTGNPRIGACKLNGSGFVTFNPYHDPHALGIGPVEHQSGGRTIQVWQDGTYLYVTSKGALLNQISLGTIIMPNIGFAISITGKYIAVVGPDGTDQKKARLQVYQGS